MAIKPIALSFKNNKEDMELYTWITSHSNMSGFIKDTLKEAKNKENNHAIKNTETKQQGLINMDF